MSTNFAKTLVWKHGNDVNCWRHKQRTPNTNDHHVTLNQPSINIFCVPHWVRLQLIMYQLKTKQNIIWWHNRSWIFYFLLHNCLHGKNLHIVLFIRIFSSWFLNVQCSLINSSNMNNLNLFSNFQGHRKIFKDKMIFKNQGHNEFW